MSRYHYRQKVALLKQYRELKTEEDRHRFLQEHGSGVMFDLPPAEYPVGYPELKPCQCGSNDLAEEYLDRFTISDVRIRCLKCGRHTAYVGVPWTARKLWNAGEIFGPDYEHKRRKQ